MRSPLSSHQHAHNHFTVENMPFSEINSVMQLLNRDSHRTYQRNDGLYCAGEVFKGIYQLRSGSAKASVCSLSGDEHIVEFHYPGDIIGIDGFDNNNYNQNILFLETSSVVCIREPEIKYLLQTSDDFRRTLLQAMSQLK